ncbi:hypothetical protein [Lysinibacillus sphaericus]|uniref:hypothetical protein n=1 Tax=Lysinibacillus sphaericus TaxID=1421 RepID=UPI0018CD93B0|nr:hypothetical protein [Lysinibacillus sphaericus]MBG9479418.1 hypothetical protein [Lysinibacillus sphaericus]
MNKENSTEQKNEQVLDQPTNEKLNDQEDKNKTENENPEIITVQLKRPVKLDEALLNEIKLDFTTMTGDKILKIDAELRSMGTSFDDLWNQAVILKLMSRASSIVEEDLKKLHAADYLEVAFRTRNFFIQW